MAQNDMGPHNMACQSTPAGNHFYIFDLGAAWPLAPGSGPQAIRQPPPHCQGPPKLCRPEFMSLQRLLGDPPSSLTDMVALVFTAVTLAGGTLPWTDGCAQGRFSTAVSQRLNFRGDHPSLACLPSAVHSFATAVLDASLGFRTKLDSAAQHLTQLQQSRPQEALSVRAPQLAAKHWPTLGTGPKLPDQQDAPAAYDDRSLSAVQQQG